MPNTFYPAVCASRQPAPTGHAACERATTVVSDTARCHVCPHGYLLAACLADVTTADIGPRLAQLASLIDPQGVAP